MKTFLIKLTAFSMLLFMLFTFTGCSDFSFNSKPDPLLTNITTKEQAVDFIIATAKSWNIVKAKAQVSFVTLPMEGHLDIQNEKAYIESYKYVDKVKVITKYYYMTADKTYQCEFLPEGNEYSIVEVIDEVGYGFKLSEILPLLTKENLDLSQFTFTKDEYSLTLSFTYQDGTETYNSKLIYKNKSIKITIANLATITLTQDDANYFNNLNIDLTLFE